MKKTKNRSKRMIKLLTTILTLLLLIGSMPLTLQAMAIETMVNIEEVKEYREEYSKHFKMPDGTFKAVSYNAPVHRMDENGEWQDLENILSENTVKDKQAYVTSDGRTVFSKKISADDNTVFELNDGGYSMKVSFENEGIKNSNAKLSNHAKKYEPTNTDDIETQYKKLKEIDTNTTVKYKNIIKNIDLEYILSANDIKENIIIRKACDDYEFSFIYELIGLSAILCEDGSISLYDSLTNEVKYSIPAPYMYDDDGIESTDVAYSLDDLGNGKYRLTVTPDETWINAEDRAFPVTVDPTVTLHANLWDTFIDQNRPTEAFGNEEDLWVSQSQITFMKSSTMLPTLPENSKITQAILNVRYYYHVSSGNISVGLHPVTFSWGTSSLTWSSASQYTNMGISPERVSSGVAIAASNITEESPGYMFFDVTDLVKKWYMGDPMYGIALKYISGTNLSVIIKSTECGTATRAYYDISYTTYIPMLAGGTYYIENVGTGRYIEVEGPSTSYGAVIQQWDLHTGSNEKWILENIKGNENHVRLKSAYSNLYIGVDSSNTTLIKQYPNSNLYTAWKVEGTSDGNIKLSCAATISQGKVLAVPLNANSNGTDLTQISYTDNSNYRDEWLLRVNRDASLIALPESYDRSSFFSEIIDYLESIGYTDNFNNHENIASGMTKSILLEYMKGSRITLVRTHGLKNLIGVSDGFLSISDFNSLPANALSQSELIIYGACLTGEGGEYDNNLVAATVTAGARTAIGFENSVYSPGCNDWCLKFFEYYKLYSNNPQMTIRDICNMTNNWMIDENHPWFEGYDSKGTLISLRNFVICGEETFP